MWWPGPGKQSREESRLKAPACMLLDAVTERLIGVCGQGDNSLVKTMIYCDSPGFDLCSKSKCSKQFSTDLITKDNSRRLA